jgi:predicted dehydrogenase
MDSIRWGIIGCGDVTEKKSGPALQKARGSELVAVMRRSAAKAADYARRHGVARWYDDADELIADPEVDAVYVATPPSTHADYTIRAARAGKPVYVEKPMAMNHDQCRAMIEACAAAGVKLFVAYYRRRLPVFLKVKELLDGGAIGDVRLASTALWHPPEAGDTDPLHHHWHVHPAISGGGYLFDLGSHLLDILDFLFGPVKTVCGIADNQAGWYDAEDIASALLTFDNGVHGLTSFCFTTSAAGRTDRIEILGSTGKITFACFDTEPVRLMTDTGIQQFDLPPPEHVQQPLIQTVVDELLGTGSCPSTAESGARTSRVLDRLVS